MTVTAPGLRGWAIVVLAAVGLLLGTTAPAGAHAALTHSTPEQGAVTARLPTRVVLVFSEKIALTSDAIRVLDPTGERVDDAHPTAQGGTAYAVGLHSTLARGTYTVAYHVVSADSHPVAGAYTFSNGAPCTTSVSAVGTGSADSGPVAHAYLAGRFGAYAGLLLLVGGACFLLVCWPAGLSRRLLRRAVITGWALVTASTAALLLLRGAYTGSGHFGDVADFSRLAEAAQTRAGVMLWARLVLLAACAAAWAWWRRSRPLPAGRGRALLTAAAAAALATTWAAAEHASAGLQSAVAMPVDVVHLLAAAVWLGGLTLLTLALFTGPELPARSVARFSRLAFTAITVLVATGLYQSWRQVGTLTALTDTRYGHLLTAKAAAVGLLLGLAFFSRRLTGRLAQDPAAPRTTTAPARVIQAVPACAGAPRPATGHENPPTPPVNTPGTVRGCAARAAPLGSGRDPGRRVRTRHHRGPHVHRNGPHPGVRHGCPARYGDRAAGRGAAFRHARTPRQGHRDRCRGSRSQRGGRGAHVGHPARRRHARRPRGAGRADPGSTGDRPAACAGASAVRGPVDHLGFPGAGVRHLGPGSDRADVGDRSDHCARPGQDRLRSGSVVGGQDHVRGQHLECAAGQVAADFSRRFQGAGVDPVRGQGAGGADLDTVDGRGGEPAGGLCNEQCTSRSRKNT
ncbi:copper resistance protein CopC [Actinacidiphila glaucinigra]|uniref:copper resistance CopC/CopD family protein n=1 Tax=Actinacidiphila glaucinigra TaxID=235986 RepID=UPI00386B6579